MTTGADTSRVTEPLSAEELAEALANIRLENISAISPHVIRRQATINIGTCGSL
jgi:hypothetical protein